MVCGSSDNHFGYIIRFGGLYSGDGRLGYSKKISSEQVSTRIHLLSLRPNSHWFISYFANASTTQHE